MTTHTDQRRHRPATNGTPGTPDADGRTGKPAVLRALGPDQLHPGQIAGPYAWAAWNLTAAVPHDELTILLPHRDGDTARLRYADQLDELLTTAHWRRPDTPTTRRRGTTITYRDHDATTTIRITTHPWYLPNPSDVAHGPVTDRHGYPLIDETTALRERLEAITRRRPHDTDVDDVRRWVEHHIADGHHQPTAALERHLTHLRREAPDAFHALEAVVEHARVRFAHLPDRRGLDAAFGHLANQMAPLRHGLRR
jgi:hypothetical protein